MVATAQACEASDEKLDTMIGLHRGRACRALCIRQGSDGLRQRRLRHHCGKTSISLVQVALYVVVHSNRAIHLVRRLEWPPRASP